MVHEALLYKKNTDKSVDCNLCAHHCHIQPEKFGICNVRQNRAGTLYTHVYGEVIAASVDPIEKKPLYHVLPGSQSFSVATIGCNFKCGFCQNWQISQVGKNGIRSHGEAMTPNEIVRQAKEHGCRTIAYTYTEPTIFFEYAYETAQIAHKNDIKNIFVTNGYMSKEAVELIAPYLDAANIDLKAFTDEFYGDLCKARLEPVLETIRNMKQKGIWIEITTLIVPEENDSESELRAIAHFIASVGTDIPWHISRFRPEYEYANSHATSLETLRHAKKIGDEAGLQYVYMGNVIEGNTTVCHVCGRELIERVGFEITSNNVANGLCSFCQSRISGIW